MKIQSASLLVSVVALLGITVAACSSSTTDNTNAAIASGNCPAVGAKLCSADDPATQADIDGCNKSKNDAKCGSKYIDVLKCYASNNTCKADNKSDDSKTEAACKSSTVAYATCLQGGGTPDAGGGDGG